jgi:hypothetical protein
VAGCGISGVKPSGSDTTAFSYPVTSHLDFFVVPTIHLSLFLPVFLFLALPIPYILSAFIFSFFAPAILVYLSLPFP